ncbi:peptidoglycan DD-metalloendopeptidase family protein [Planococcus sp. APC 4015]|nr:peptidoglycan DD-metalloendopeptidase family protein [Planococcus sp. APC 4015]
MQSDRPQAEPALTRRSSRASSTPVQAQQETPGASRAELRRQAAAATFVEAVLPAIVVDASAVAEAPAGLTRRGTRAARMPAEAPADVQTPAEPVELIAPEPAVVEEPVVLDEPVAEASDLDEFEAAARLFAFTGENPVMADAAEPAAAESVPHTIGRGARRRRGVMLKRVAGASFSVGVMGIVGLLTVGLTTPAEAVAVAGSTDISSASVSLAVEDDAAPDDEIQAYVAPSSVQNADISKTESYSTVTMQELAYASGIKNVSSFFVNDPNSAIQWPFAVGVPITYGFGMRSGAMHQGVDFVPGAGAPIQAIADGTVRVATNSGGGYGVHVIIDHVIDGQLISSHYAHMITGSIAVTEGQQVTVGTVLGKTGNTGRSFGAHTHFELLLNGTTAIDPIPWLREHAGG